MCTMMKRKQIRFEEITKALYEIYCKKNFDYGDAFARTRVNHKDEILILLSNKLKRLEAVMHNSDIKVQESIEDTLIDIANYAILELIERQEDDMYDELARQAQLEKQYNTNISFQSPMKGVDTYEQF